MPRQDRATLALISIIFWVAAIWQAAYTPAQGASVFSFFGLGLLYLFFSVSNLVAAVIRAINQYTAGKMNEAQPSELLQLLVVMIGMMIANGVVLAIYLFHGTSFTQVDVISFVVGLLILGVLIVVYGLKRVFIHPWARGWLAIAGKTVPQLAMTWLFLTTPSAVHGFALVTMLGVDVLSGLRFWPTLKAFLRDRQSEHLRGLLLGEAGNCASAFSLSVAWLFARLH